MLEQYLALDQFSDEQTSQMLQAIFSWEPIINLMKNADPFNQSQLK